MQSGQSSWGRSLLLCGGGWEAQSRRNQMASFVCGASGQLEGACCPASDLSPPAPSAFRSPVAGASFTAEQAFQEQRWKNQRSFEALNDRRPGRAQVAFCLLSIRPRARARCVRGGLCRRLGGHDFRQAALSVSEHASGSHSPSLAVCSRLLISCGFCDHTANSLLHLIFPLTFCTKDACSPRPQVLVR